VFRAGLAVGDKERLRISAIYRSRARGREGERPCGRAANGDDSREVGSSPRHAIGRRDIHGDLNCVGDRALHRPQSFGFKVTKPVTLTAALNQSAAQCHKADPEEALSLIVVFALETTGGPSLTT
jgi:hypothetical protein